MGLRRAYPVQTAGGLCAWCLLQVKCSVSVAMNESIERGFFLPGCIVQVKACAQ